MILATGSDLTQASFVSHFRNMKNASTYGFDPKRSGAENTEIINRVIREVSEAGGGAVQISCGIYPVYTIELQSNVTLLFREGAVLKAARPEPDGGNYLPPEVNRFKGLQDGGHTYFANSLIYGRNVENVRITGPGLIDGSFLIEESGEVEYTLSGDDCEDTDHRDLPGHTGTWFGNKAIALADCRNIMLEGFSILIGGHFAILATCVENLCIDRLLVDTNRDALNLDGCKNVTVKGSTFNSLTDDAIVLKASMGAGKICPAENVLIEDCIVSGYDAGSVYAGKYTRSKLVADDRGGPTGRVKFGTEGTGGFHTVTVRRVKFRRSRGFCIETVDCAQMHDILLEHCEMTDVSSSPIFIRVGDRGRYPVTGNYEDGALHHENDVRIDHTEWVLPNAENYPKYPAQRYQPSYARTGEVCVDGKSSFRVADGKQPAGQNAVGTKALAHASDIIIRKVRIHNADPRYPILLMGLTDSPIENVELSDITCEYRGGITMEMATEQRQLNTNWAYSQFRAPLRVQSLPWLVNTFFAKNEALLPRVRRNPGTGEWVPDPFNIPECVDVYPEPENWGILPAYGIFARHVRNLKLKNITCTVKNPDERAFCVLDDVQGGSLEILKCHNPDGHAESTGNVYRNEIILVENRFRRHTNEEMIPDRPYFTTTVEGLSNESKLKTRRVAVEAPAPGTPKDSLYPYETCAWPETGYEYAVRTEEYPLPRTVFRPWAEIPFYEDYPAEQEILLHVRIHDPAQECTFDLSPNDGFRDVVSDRAKANAAVAAKPHPLYVTGALETLDEDEFEEEFTVLPVIPAGALEFDFILPPQKPGTRRIRIGCDDGVGTENLEMELTFVSGK